MVRGFEATGARPLRRLPTLASVAHYAQEGRRSKNAKQRGAPGSGISECPLFLFCVRALTCSAELAFVKIDTTLGLRRCGVRAILYVSLHNSYGTGSFLTFVFLDVIKRTWPCPILQEGGVAAIMHKLCRTCATPRRWNR